MPFPVFGISAINDCSAGPGSCGVNCNDRCTANTYICAWPDFSECSGAPNCSDQSTRFITNGCGKILYFFDHCTGNSVCANIQDCGPNDGQFSSGGFCNTTRHKLVACVNTAAFSVLCGFCNPQTYGVIYTRICGTGCAAC
jgi:hypothetical protein